MIREIFERSAPEEEFTQPAGWGNDTLSKYLRNGVDCSYYTYNTQGPQVRRLNSLLELFTEGDQHLSAARRAFSRTLVKFRGFDAARPFLPACRADIVAAA